MPGIAVISMDNFNDGSKVVDSNFDGEWLWHHFWAGWFVTAWSAERLTNAHHSPAAPGAADNTNAQSHATADPRLTDYDLLLQNLADLQQGKPAEVRVRACVCIKSQHTLSFVQMRHCHPFPVSPLPARHFACPSDFKTDPNLRLQVELARWLHHPARP
jgi:hypothetical protein